MPTSMIHTYIYAFPMLSTICAGPWGVHVVPYICNLACLDLVGCDVFNRSRSEKFQVEDAVVVRANGFSISEAFDCTLD